MRRGSRLDNLEERILQEIKETDMPSANIKNWEIYLGGTLGALALGLADVLRNGASSMVLKLGEQLVPLLKALELSIDRGPFIGVMLLIVLGLVLCWVHQPQGRAEAYARGASVFAILATLVPPPDVTGKTDLSLVPPLFSTAYADEVSSVSESAAAPSAPTIDNGKVPQSFEHAGATTGQFVELLLPADATEHARVTVRDYDSAQILSITQQPGTQFDIQQPEGRYILDIEASGLRRSRAIIDIGSSPQAPLQLQINKSSVPLNLQRLYSPAQVLPETEISQ
jgi:hypothetical protein